MNTILSKIFLCKTHKRFKKLFADLEDEAFFLNIYADKLSSSDYLLMRSRRHNKNFVKALKLYRQFTGDEWAYCE